jgi:serine/threonine protein kinase
VSEGSPTERFGPYIVYEQLGVGGMAQVHRAVAANSDVRRPVALKRMLSHIAGSEDMVKSFVREARLASYLRHENVAQTYDLGRVGDIYFIVMELITGRNLREVLRHCGATTGPMPVPVALNILNQICDALDYAHNLCSDTGEPLGIIHRDVSPSNVIVSDSGVVKLIDFGIAKASGAGMQTMSGTLKGKFAYMAPEYIAGRIDARADLFAVGVIAHELLTNRPLFSGRDDIDTLTRVRDMHIDPPSKKNPQVPPEIDDIVMTALARDPDRRWQHATALRSALTTLTRRLGLIASNAQAIQWLDWAFAHPRRRRPGSDGDTETDPEPTSEEPSISIEPGTVDAGMSGKITLVMRDGDPDPPTQTPLGTPAYVPAQHPLPAGLVSPSERPASNPAPGLAPLGAVPAAPIGARVSGLASSPGQLAPTTSLVPTSPIAPTAPTVPLLGSPTTPFVPAAPLASTRTLADAAPPPVGRGSQAFPRAPSQPPANAAPPAAAHHYPGSSSAPPAAAHHHPSSLPLDSQRARSPSQSPPMAGPPHRPSSPSQPPPIASPSLRPASSQPPPVASPSLRPASSQPPPIASPSLRPASSQPPPMGGPPPPRPSSASQPPPIAAQLAPPSAMQPFPSAMQPFPSAMQPLPSAMQPAPIPGLPAASHATLPGGYPAPAPPPPGSALASFAAQRAKRPSQAAPVPGGPYPTPSPAQRDPARTSVPPSVLPRLPRYGHLMPVLLVVLAAAAAATTVYFVLPLLT